MYLADVARRVILVVLFDNRTTLGLVKLRVRTAVPELVKVFDGDVQQRGDRRASRWNQGCWAKPKTRSTSSSGCEGASSMSMINYASREINCKLVYYGPGLGGKTTNLEHVYQKVAPDRAGEDDLPGHGDRAHPLLRLPAGGPRHHPRVQGQVPPLHRAGPGLLQRLAQADPQGRGRRGVRGRQPDRAHGGEHRGDAEPVRQHGAARLRPDPHSVRHPVQQARPAQRRARSPSCRPRSTRAGRSRTRRSSGSRRTRTGPASSSCSSRTGSGSSGRRTSRRWR